MGETALRPGFNMEDKVGLGVAIVLHVLLVAALALQFMLSPPRSITPERMTVSLATEISLESTAPDPVTESRAAIAPTLANEAAPEADSAPIDVTPTATAPPPPPQTRTPTRTAPRTPTPPRNRTRPDRQPTPTPTRAARNSGGSRVGDNFLEGRGSSTRTDDIRIPASEIGRSATASVIQSIVRQIRPHWTAPSGVDAELLVTELAFDLNEDGSLKGRPRVLRQSGDNAGNRTQKALHAERAIRAVQLAAPFDLPPEYYNAWKSIRGARFDRNLSR